MDSFLMLGQSNMAGRGILSEVEPINPDRLFVMRNGLWQNLYIPVNPDRAFSGISLAESFARQYSDEYDCDVGLIPCAEGNTSILQWQKGEILFDHAVMMTTLAKRTTNLKGILWHQGEADCNELNNTSYKNNLVKMLRDFRKAIDMPDIPVVMGGLGEFLPQRSENYKKYYPVINEAIAAAAEEIDNAVFVGADGLQPNDDLLHFNSRSLRTFGLRYFEEYKKLIKKREDYE